MTTKDAMPVKAQDGKVTGKMSVAQWQAVIDVNLTGARMIDLKAGRVIELDGGQRM